MEGAMLPDFLGGLGLAILNRVLAGPGNDRAQHRIRAGKMLNCLPHEKPRTPPRASLE